MSEATVVYDKSESTMVCETVWDEAPDRVVFERHTEWGVYKPERTCRDIAVPCGDKYEFKCSECDGEYSALGRFGCDQGDEPDFDYCPWCGAKVIRDE